MQDDPDEMKPNDKNGHIKKYIHKKASSCKRWPDHGEGRQSVYESFGLDFEFPLSFQPEYFNHTCIINIMLN